MINAKSVVVLPAHNEEDAILPVVEDVLNNCDCDVVVSCSGCSDSTHIYLKHEFHFHDNNPRVHVLRSHKGKGLAIKKAFSEVQAERIIMMDADATYPADKIPDFVDQLRIYDAVIGRRLLFDGQNISALNRFGNAFLTRNAQILYNSPINDLCTGMWGFNGKILDKLNIKSHGFTLEAELFVYLMKNHYSIGEIPITYNRRIGESKLKRTEAFKILWYLWSRRFV